MKNKSFTVEGSVTVTCETNYEPGSIVYKVT